jgi:ATP-dependent RNA helicase DeaD
VTAFAELGLGDGIRAAARAAGYAAPTPLQAAAIPVLRRGGNVLLHASAGAGVTAAFGLALLDRLVEGAAEASGPRALVLAPTPERAEAVAEGLAALAGPTGITVRAAGAGWKPGGDIVVMTPAQALRTVQESALKLESVQTLVVLDASELYTLGYGETLELLIPLVPRTAQRVVTSTAVTPAVEQLVEAHARRALTVPSRPADPAATRAQEPIGQIGYLVVQEDAKPALLARLFEHVDEQGIVFARTAARAERVAAALARRGIGVEDGAGAVRAVGFDSVPAPSADRVVSYDVPFSAEQLRAIHANGGTVLVTPLELPHLQRIAAEVPFTLKHRRARGGERDALDAFRATIRGALETEDLDAQLLVLQPLLEERSAEEIAAALSGLLRRRIPAPAAPADAVAGAPPPSAPATFTRLFVSIGSRDNIRPGDLVGAITGEAGIKGDQVGRIDIRDTFSVVEIAASVADRVIRALNGTTMRGRSLRVDYDRKSGVGEERRPAPRGPGPGRSEPSGRGAGAGRGSAPRRRPPADR